MRSKEAPHPDDIPPTCFKALGPRTKSELLEIINCSFATGTSPQIWKRAVILPLKKAEKQPGTIVSYRPVSLTSCVAKTMERMISNRLYYLAETRNWLCPEQAGFRTSRSGEDQILRVTQTISNGYQATKPKRTVRALLDFSKTFDRAWKENLLLRAVDKVLPLTFAKWLRDFLSNRQARVQINGEQG